MGVAFRGTEFYRGEAERLLKGSYQNKEEVLMDSCSEHIRDLCDYIDKLSYALEECRAQKEEV